MNKRLCAVLFCLFCAMVSPVHADDDDHERARRALQAGEVLSLATVLERLEHSHPGQVLEVELENEDEGWVYEIKLLQTDGRLLKLELDARDGSLLRSRSRPMRGGHD